MSAVDTHATVTPARRETALVRSRLGQRRLDDGHGHGQDGGGSHGGRRQEASEARGEMGGRLRGEVAHGREEWGRAHNRMLSREGERGDRVAWVSVSSRATLRRPLPSAAHGPHSAQRDSLRGTGARGGMSAARDEARGRGRVGESRERKKQSSAWLGWFIDPRNAARHSSWPRDAPDTCGLDWRPQNVRLDQPAKANTPPTDASKHLPTSNTVSYDYMPWLGASLAST